MGCMESDDGQEEMRKQELVAKRWEASKMGKKKDRAVPKLIYFDAYALGESIRMMLNHANV